MAQSPYTPTHSRHASLVQDSPAVSPINRRQSRSSLEPSTPLRNSFHQQEILDISVFGSGNQNGGLGNLADELADAFSDSGDEGDYYENAAPNINVSPQEEKEISRIGVTGASGVDVASRQGDGSSRAKSMSLSLPSPKRVHRRAGSEYDGSEYGSDSDLDSPGIPLSLVAKMDAVESLARRGTESTGSAVDGVFQRVTDSLRDLGSQTGVEGSATRLITAHSALTTHLTHQSRQIQSLAFPLFSPLVTPPDSETIDDIMPLLYTLSETIPRPSTAAYNSLTALHTLTSDLIQTLNYLSDTLHMSRQTTTTATRRLRSAKELVADMKKEEALREEGQRWLARGNWSERLKKRECAAVCGEVVGGFEEVCNDWRARLLAQAESAPA